MRKRESSRVKQKFPSAPIALHIIYSPHPRSKHNYSYVLEASTNCRSCSLTPNPPSATNPPALDTSPISHGGTTAAAVGIFSATCTLCTSFLSTKTPTSTPRVETSVHASTAGLNTAAGKWRVQAGPTAKAPKTTRRLPPHLLSIAPATVPEVRWGVYLERARACLKAWAPVFRGIGTGVRFETHLCTEEGHTFTIYDHTADS